MGEHRLTVLENRVLWKILGSRREKVNGIQGAVYYLHDKIKQNEVRLEGDVACVGRKKMCAGFSGGNLKERHCLESMHIDGRIILKWTLKKWGGGIGFIWLKIGTSDGLL